MSIDRDDLTKGVPDERSDEAIAGTEAGGGSAPAERRRPAPGPVAGAPSPSSRARRAAAAGVQSGLRRPSPGPDRANSPARPVAPEDQPDKPIPARSVAARSVAVTPGIDPVAELDAEPTAHRVRARSPLWLAVALAVAVLLLAGASGLLASMSSRSGSVSQRDQALSAAKSSVPLILSYNYKSFDGDLAKAQAQLTGRAKTDYVKAMSSTIKPAATKASVVVQAQTDSAGVESVSANGDQVTVVVFGEQRVTNSALTAPRIDPFRVRATLDRVAGHWLVSKFDQI